MTQILTKDQIRQWISDNPGLMAKRDIAKAFGIKGDGKIELKRLLKELETDGTLVRKRRSYREADKLPPVSILTILAPDSQGDLFAAPTEWASEDAPPGILFIPRKGDEALGAGDRILARLAEVSAADHAYEARLIRKIGANPLKVLGDRKSSCRERV